VLVVFGGGGGCISGGAGHIGVCSSLLQNSKAPNCISAKGCWLWSWKLPWRAAVTAPFIYWESNLIIHTSIFRGPLIVLLAGWPFISVEFNNGERKKYSLESSICNMYTQQKVQMLCSHNANQLVSGALRSQHLKGFSYFLSLISNALLK
jgi:hypothetical protein